VDSQEKNLEGALKIILRSLILFLEKTHLNVIVGEDQEKIYEQFISKQKLLNNFRGKTLTKQRNLI